MRFTIRSCNAEPPNWTRDRKQKQASDVFVRSLKSLAVLPPPPLLATNEAWLSQQPEPSQRRTLARVSPSSDSTEFVSRLCSGSRVRECMWQYVRDFHHRTSYRTASVERPFKLCCSIGGTVNRWLPPEKCATCCPSVRAPASMIQLMLL